MTPSTRVAQVSHVAPFTPDPTGRPDSVIADLASRNDRLRKKVESQQLDIAKLEAENRRQAELSQFLTDELEAMKKDLDRVEKQFISVEQRLKTKETKASAVASVAEAQLLLDKMQERGKGVLDKSTLKEVKSKLKTCDDMITQRNYSAAVYFSRRAIRILNQTERRMHVAADGDARIIAVSRANVRSGPGSRYDIIGKLDYGTVIVQLSTKANWSQIRTKEGTAGWVHSSLIR